MGKTNKIRVLTAVGNNSTIINALSKMETILEKNFFGNVDKLKLCVYNIDTKI